jgi:membrane-associated phospholipid phosphatase
VRATVAVVGRGGLQVAGVTSAAFVVLTVLVAFEWGPLVELDRSVAESAGAFAAAHPDWVAVLRVCTTVAGPLPFRLLVVAVAVGLVVRREVRAAVFAITAITAGGVLSTAVKVWVGRVRPAVPHPYADAAGMAFPSGHAGTAALACGILLLLVLHAVHGMWRVLAWTVAVAVPLAVGYTRIGLDVHWVSDVVGGWLLGLAVVAAVHAAVSPGERPAAGSVAGPALGGAVRRSGRCR